MSILFGGFLLKKGSASSLILVDVWQRIGMKAAKNREIDTFIFFKNKL
jgi:hypothetical protein